MLYSIVSYGYKIVLFEIVIIAQGHVISNNVVF